MQDKKLIVPVCRGNIARSAVSEVLIRRLIEEYGLDSEYETVSRGVQGTSIDPQPVTFPNITYYTHISLYSDSKPWLDEHGIDLSGHISKPIDEEVAERASIMLAMDDKTLQGLLELFPDQGEKVYLLKQLIGEDTDIIDPEGVSGVEKQARIFSEIQSTLREGFPTLLALTEGASEVRRDINREGSVEINRRMQERK